MKLMLLLAAAAIGAGSIVGASEGTETVKMNVGGHLFEVSVDIMTKHPESRLAQILSKASGREQDNPLFIGHNGEVFAHVLALHRDGKVLLPSTVSKDVFIRELGFYGIPYDEQHIIDEETLDFDEEILAKQMEVLANMCVSEAARMVDQCVGGGNIMCADEAKLWASTCVSAADQIQDDMKIYTNCEKALSRRVSALDDCMELRDECDEVLFSVNRELGSLLRAFSYDPMWIGEVF